MNKYRIKVDRSSENAYSKGDIKIDTEFQVPSPLEAAEKILDLAGKVVKDTLRETSTVIEIDRQNRQTHLDKDFVQENEDYQSQSEVQDAVIEREEEIKEEFTEESTE